MSAWEGSKMQEAQERGKGYAPPPDPLTDGRGRHPAVEAGEIPAVTRAEKDALIAKLRADLETERFERGKIAEDFRRASADYLQAAERSIGEIGRLRAEFNQAVYEKDVARRDATRAETERERLRNALDEIALYGTSRPAEMGAGDDGDGHWRWIGCRLISIAARARGYAPEEGAPS